MISILEMAKKRTALANLFNILMGHQHTHMSTLELLQAGIMSPAAGIARLKAAGVQIDTVYGTVVDANGAIHNNVAHYKIVGGFTQ